MVVHDQAVLLEQNLPQFLAVAEASNAEVIVVDDMSQDSTPDILQRAKADHPNLYTTFLPQSVVINPSRVRLALSIGVKAAKGDYVVIADIRRPPLSKEWLTELADGEAAVVYSDRTGSKVCHVVASELDDFHSLILKAERKSGRGHRGRWMKKFRGHYDALSVRHDQAYNAILLFDQAVSTWQLVGLRIRTWL